MLELKLNDVIKLFYLKLPRLLRNLFGSIGIKIGEQNFPARNLYANLVFRNGFRVLSGEITP